MSMMPMAQPMQGMWARPMVNDRIRWETRNLQCDGECCQACFCPCVRVKKNHEEFGNFHEAKQHSDLVAVCATIFFGAQAFQYVMPFSRSHGYTLYMIIEVIGTCAWIVMAYFLLKSRRVCAEKMQIYPADADPADMCCVCFTWTWPLMQEMKTIEMWKKRGMAGPPMMGIPGMMPHGMMIAPGPAMQQQQPMYGNNINQQQFQNAGSPMNAGGPRHFNSPPSLAPAGGPGGAGIAQGHTIQK